MMRDIIDDERQRLRSQGLAAQRVAAARHRQLRCDSVGRNHILALVTPHFQPRAARNAPVRLLPRAARARRRYPMAADSPADCARNSTGRWWNRSLGLISGGKRGALSVRIWRIPTELQRDDRSREGLISPRRGGETVGGQTV